MSENKIQNSMHHLYNQSAACQPEFFCLPGFCPACA
jgi:hypothetical protein